MSRLCSPAPKPKKTLYQKVIIPKGMVNPTETTIIEIPVKLQKQPVVVAKRKTQDKFEENEPPAVENVEQATRPKANSDPVGATKRAMTEYKPTSAPKCNDGGHESPSSPMYCDPVCATRPATTEYKPTSAHGAPKGNDGGYESPSSPVHCDAVCASKSAQYMPRAAPPVHHTPPPPAPQPAPSSYNRRGCDPKLICPPLEDSYPYSLPQQPLRPPSSFPRSVDTNSYNYPNSSDLIETEKQELQALKQNLEEFQRARRKLLMSTSSLARSTAAPGTDDGGIGGVMGRQPNVHYASVPSYNPSSHVMYRPPAPQQQMPLRVPQNYMRYGNIPQSYAPQQSYEQQAYAGQLRGFPGSSGFASGPPPPRAYTYAPSAAQQQHFPQPTQRANTFGGRPSSGQMLTMKISHTKTVTELNPSPQNQPLQQNKPPPQNKPLPQNKSPPQKPSTHAVKIKQPIPDDTCGCLDDK